MVKDSIADRVSPKRLKQNANKRCDCGHVRMLHIGEHGPCGIKGCECTEYVDPPKQRRPRRQPMGEPQRLFDV